MISKKELDKIYETDDYVNSYHSEPGDRLKRLISFMNLKKTDVVADYACGNA